MEHKRFDDLDWLGKPVVKTVIAEVARTVTEQVIAEHIKSCPHAQRLTLRWAYLIGACAGWGLLGGGLGVALAKLLLHV